MPGGMVTIQSHTEKSDQPLVIENGQVVIVNETSGDHDGDAE